ncbi:uncharacterized protein N7498_005140 [Penicillium cinerascens]|uniref:Uncharacterized protein n=1 Tax=Penicillium cinerascens TaxID=70096 RepID=A0A9W9T041_9EURO|nr:uncharacterized protein N7498_005140 [Penicillium cinerascens]KAJ5204261.1 hypothetical protein N7498_005140 [Penicillium cinerascens]
MASTITNGRANAMRTRNVAIASMIAVVTSNWLLFRAQSPNSKDVLYTEKDKKMMNGQTGSAATARTPSRERAEKH